MRIPVKDRTIVKNSKVSGKGLFSNCVIRKGQKIGTMKGYITKSDSPRTLWLSSKRGLRVTNKMKYANHEWQNPNAEIRETTLFAIKDIKEGEEIIWDYSCGYAYETSFNKNKPVLDNQGWGVIHWAVLKNNLKLVKECIKEDRKNLFLRTNDYYKQTPLLVAIDLGRYEIVQYLSKKHRPWETPESSTDDFNPLHWAFYRKNDKISLYLAKRFPRLLRRESWAKERPIYYLFRFKKYALLKEVIKISIKHNYYVTHYSEDYDCNYYLRDAVVDTKNTSLLNLGIKLFPESILSRLLWDKNYKFASKIYKKKTFKSQGYEYIIAAHNKNYELMAYFLNKKNTNWKFYDWMAPYLSKLPKKHLNNILNNYNELYSKGWRIPTSVPPEDFIKYNLEEFLSFY